MTYWSTALLALGLITNAQAASAVKVPTVAQTVAAAATNSTSTGAECVAEEQSGDWKNYCSCYAKFLQENCADCTQHGSMVCSLASTFAKTLGKDRSKVECEQQVDDVSSNPDKYPNCKHNIGVQQCTEQLVDYQTHC